MSYLVAGIVASTAVSSIAGSSAKKAQEEADRIAKYSDLIDVERQAQSNFITKFNETRELASIESEQDAMSSAMGKRTTSAGLQRMQSIAKEDQERNFERMDADIALSRKMGKVNVSARESASDASATTRDLGLLSSTLKSGLMLLGK